MKPNQITAKPNQITAKPNQITAKTNQITAKTNITTKKHTKVFWICIGLLIFVLVIASVMIPLYFLVIKKKNTVKNQCTCDNGTSATGNDCTTNGAKICSECDNGYHLDGHKCVPDPPSPNPPSPKPPCGMQVPMCITGGMFAPSPWGACGLLVSTNPDYYQCWSESDHNNHAAPSISLNDDTCSKCTPITIEQFHDQSTQTWCADNCCYFNYEENNMNSTDCWGNSIQSLYQ